MERYTRAEFVVLLIMLLLNVFFVVFLVGFGNLSGFSIFGSGEASVPSDFISDSAISYEEGMIQIGAENVVFYDYADSASMAPLLSSTATGIGMIVDSSDVIHVGDVISFWRDDEVIVHRVIAKGEDENGIYFITKGDNNSSDDGKVYFSEVISVLIGVVY